MSLSCAVGFWNVLLTVIKTYLYSGITLKRQGSTDVWMYDFATQWLHGRVYSELVKVQAIQ